MSMNFEFTLKTAQLLLDKLELEDAEEKFCCLLNDLNIMETQKHKNKPKNSAFLEVECLIGIAECRSKSFKMGRYLKDDFWFQCFILPLCLLDKSKLLCRSIIERNIDLTKTDELMEENQNGLRNRLNRLDFQISSLEDNFVRGFLRKTFNSNNNQQTKLDSPISINKNWIMDLMKVCDVADVDAWSKKKKLASKAPHDTSNPIKISVDDLNMSTQNSTKTGNSQFPLHKLKTSHSFRQSRPTFSIKDDSKEELKIVKTPRSRDISSNPSSSKTRIINFERFQDAIQSFVSEISTEVRSRYGHLSKVPESLIEKRLASEIALRLSPGSIQAEDYINVLEGALVAGINEPSKKEVDDLDKEEAERLAEMERLDKEKQRLLSLDDEMDEDQESYETLQLDIGNLLQIPGSEQVKIIESLTDIQSSDNLSQHKTLTWTGQFTQRDESLSLAVPLSKEVAPLVSNDKFLHVVSLPRTIQKLRQDILFVWKKIQTEKGSQELNKTNKKSKDQNIDKKFSLMKESHFEELPNLNQECKNIADEIDRHEIIIEIERWPFKQIRKSNIVSMFLELIVKAARCESQENRHLESVELLQIADQIINEIWNTSNLEDDAKEKVSLVWTNLGDELSKIGQVSKGSYYLEKRKTLSSSHCSETKVPGNETTEIFEEVQGWCKLGDAYLGEDLRSESLLARLMQLTKQELARRDEGADNENKHSHKFLKDLYQNCNEGLLDKLDDDNEHDDDDDEDDDKEQKDVYCTCLQEAVDCFSIATNILQSNRSVIGTSRPELWSEILTKTADCHLMSGNLDLAETAYDEALEHVSRAVGSEHLKRNADAILALATLCFLTGNDVRACTLLLTSLALRGKYCDKRGSTNIRNDYSSLDPNGLLKIYDSLNALDLDDEDTDFGTVWTLIILSLSHHSLGKPYQTISWASRAFQAHGKFFHGRLVAVDPLNRWFLVRILISSAMNHVILSNPLESINRLILAQKFLEVSRTVDRIQLSQIFKITGDANLLLSTGMGLKPEVVDNDTLAKYSEKSEEYYSKALGLLKHENNRAHFEKLFEMIKFFKAHRSYSSVNKLHKFDSSQLQISWKERKNEIETKPTEIENKCDLISILLEMANDHVMNHNLDQSLACFVECSKELEKSWTAGRRENEGFLLASVYFRLGRLLHVKYLMSCDQPEELQCFSDESIRVFSNADEIARDLMDGEKLHFDIQLAKSLLLYDLGKKFDAIQNILPILLKDGSGDDDVVFSGQEILALPKQLRLMFSESSFDSSLVIKRRSLLGLLATTCYCEINLMDYATEAICPMIINYDLKPDNILDNVSLSFSFMNVKSYDEAYRVFTDISKSCCECATRKYLVRCAYICLLLHLRFQIGRVASIALEQTFANLKKTFRLLTFNEFLSRLFERLRTRCNSIGAPRKVSVRSTFPQVPHVEWRSGFCGRLENSRKSPNSVSFKIETGIKSRNEIPNINYNQYSYNTKLQSQNKPHPANQMFRVI